MDRSLREKFLQQVPLFTQCTQDEIVKIAQASDIVTQKKNRHFYYAGEPSEKMYIIVEGSVELSVYNEEVEKNFRISVLKDRDVFGIGELFKENYYLNAYATMNTICIVFNKNKFLEFVETIPSLNKNVLHLFADLISIYMLLMKTGFKEGRMRLLNYLYFLYTDYGQKTDTTFIKIEYTVTQDKIAEIIHVSRQHVVRLFDEFKRDGILRVENRELFVNKERLEDEINHPELADSLRYHFNE